MGRATNSAIQANANKPMSSPYIGDVMFNCFIRPSDFKHACAVIVSGDSINFCGHALLHIGGTGRYFHVAGFKEALIYSWRRPRPRENAPRGVANPRDTTGYRSGLRLAGHIFRDRFLRARINKCFLNEVPRFMHEIGYKRYLKEGGKREIRRRHVPIPDPLAAHRKLEELLAKRWQWLLLPNNCASFVEDIVQAGGSKAGLYLNCPSAEKFK